MQRTYLPSPKEVEKKWYVIDASGKPLGRLAARVASVLRGKHKPIYTPFMDTGDFVIVVNAEKVVLTGKKPRQKFYFRHSGYPGGARMVAASEMRSRWPERMITMAVRGMLPHNRLGRALIKKLKVYRGPDHPHAAQQPETLPF